MRHRGHRNLRSGLVWGLLLPALALLAHVPPGGAAEREEPANVLLVYTEPRLLPSILDLDDGIRSTLQARSSKPIVFLTEFLDLPSPRAAGYERRLLDVIRLKYEGVKLDLVICGGSRALRLVLAHRAELFPHVPIVFSAENRADVADLVLGPDVMGVFMLIDWKGTLEVALRLQPDTRRVIVVGGTADLDRRILARARETLSAHPGPVAFTYLTDLPVDRLVKEVAALPEGTVILFGSLLRDGTGRTFFSRDVISRLASASTVPIYGLVETQLGYGIVGGRLISFRAQGAGVAELGLRALRASSAEPAAAVDPIENVATFDWRQLERWGLSEARLPPGSVVRYRPPSLWELYRWYIVGIVAIGGVEVLLIGALVLQKRRRRRAEAAFAERLRFDSLLSEISAALVDAPPGALDKEMERTLQRVVQFLGVDRGILHAYESDGRIRRISWAVDGVEPLPAVLERGRFPWAAERTRRGEVVRFARLDELPAEASVDRESYAAVGTQSHISLGLRAGGPMVGVLSFDRARPGWVCSDELTGRLQRLGEIFAGALARRRAALALEERLRFEALLSELSAAFVNLPTAEIDRAIEDGQRRICEALDLDRSTLWEFPRDSRGAVSTRSWIRPGLEPTPSIPGPRAYPWGRQRLLRGDMLAYSSVDELPAEAARDKQSARAAGTRSAVVWPLMTGGVVFGALSFAAIRAERAWPRTLVQGLRLVAEVFGNALVRKEAETTVRESEERFRLMADSAPVMVWMAGLDGGCIYFNQRWLDFTGRPLAREMGSGWSEGVHPDELHGCLDTYHRAFAARQPFTMEYRLRRFDGEHRWVLDHGVPRFGRDGDFRGYIGSCVDTTELKTTQQALLESKTLAGTIFTSLYGRVAAVDRDGVIIAVNESWSRFARENGADPDRVSIGASYLDVCLGATGAGDSDARQALEAILSVLDGRALQASLEYACQSPTQIRWFEMSVEPLRRSDGGAVISHVDITQRRRAQEEARRQREELAHALRVTTMGELAGSLAHEINQPLAAIVTNAQAAGRLLDGAGLDHADVRGALTDIVDQGKRAAQVIGRLRALFRKDRSERELLDLAELVTGVAALLRHDVERKGIALAFHLAEKLPLVPGDSIQLQQVILNLLVNACEAMTAAASGARELVIETAPRGTDGVEVSIRDSGPGLEESELERIFEPFVTTKAAGLGMGLSISRSIIAAHGGRIWATRNADRGITVHVELPAEERAQPSAGPVSTGAGGRKVDPDRAVYDQGPIDAGSDRRGSSTSL